LAENQCSGAALVSRLLNQLARFTGEGWEQENHITMVLLERSAAIDIEPVPALQLGAADLPAAARFEEDSASTRSATSARDDQAPTSVGTPVTDGYRESDGRMGEKVARSGGR
jgi:hypothetical protein